MEIPKRLQRPRGPRPEYQFATMEVGKENGEHVLCRVSNRDRKWNSIRTLCAKHTRDSKGEKEFKCYPTETGVFYWREK